jgi:hypothetical protein
LHFAFFVFHFAFVATAAGGMKNEKRKMQNRPMKAKPLTSSLSLGYRGEGVRG